MNKRSLCLTLLDWCDVKPLNLERSSAPQVFTHARHIKNGAPDPPALQMKHYLHLNQIILKSPVPRRSLSGDTRRFESDWCAAGGVPGVS